MKTKKLNKKLVFSKSTIADLGNADMKEVYGGIFSFPETICRCNSYLSKCCSENPMTKQYSNCPPCVYTETC